jgi:hypothetical protein
VTKYLFTFANPPAKVIYNGERTSVFPYGFHVAFFLVERERIKKEKFAFT